MNIKEIEARPEVDCVEIGFAPPGAGNRVMIYLADGWRAHDMTGTLCGATVREAAKGLKNIEQGDPE